MKNKGWNRKDEVGRQSLGKGLVIVHEKNIEFKKIE
jgi:hypothetical protein